MTQKPNHTCRICGTRYYACSQCDKRKNWRAFCDKPECYQVFQVLLLYARELIDATEAAETLMNLGVTPDNCRGMLPQKVAEISAVFEAAKPVAVQEEPVLDNNCETDV